MLAQRIRLGLTQPGQVRPGKPLRLVPVIAVGGRVKNPGVANERMIAVEAALSRAGFRLNDLEVWQVGNDGTIGIREVGQLAITVSSPVLITGIPQGGSA
ncbi:MAG: hypothetical protein ACRDLA_11500 [Thermoleophilaceae bacterium]